MWRECSHQCGAAICRSCLAAHPPSTGASALPVRACPGVIFIIDILKLLCFKIRYTALEMIHILNGLMLSCDFLIAQENTHSRCASKDILIRASITPDRVKRTCYAEHGPAMSDGGLLCLSGSCSVYGTGEAAVHLLGRMLAFDPERRISAEEALAHEYFTALETSSIDDIGELSL